MTQAEDREMQECCEGTSKLTHNPAEGTPMIAVTRRLETSSTSILDGSSVADVKGKPAMERVLKAHCGGSTQSTCRGWILKIRQCCSRGDRREGGGNKGIIQGTEGYHKSGARHPRVPEGLHRAA